MERKEADPYHVSRLGGDGDPFALKSNTIIILLAVNYKNPFILIGGRLEHCIWLLQVVWLLLIIEVLTVFSFYSIWEKDCSGRGRRQSEVNIHAWFSSFIHNLLSVGLNRCWCFGSWIFDVAPFWGSQFGKFKLVICHQILRCFD